MTVEDMFMKRMQMWILLVAVASAAAAIFPNKAEKKTKEKVALFIIDVQDCFLPGGSMPVPRGEEIIPVINKIRKEFQKTFSLVVRSQDWHCWDHVSFASQHPGMEPYSEVNLTYNSQGNEFHVGDAGVKLNFQVEGNWRWIVCAAGMLCYGPGVDSKYPYAENCVPHPPGGKEVAQTLWPDHCIELVTSGPTSSGFSPLLDQEPSDVIIRKGYRCWIDSYSAFFDNGGFTKTELDEVLKQYGIGVVVVTGLALDYCVYFTSMDAMTLGYKVVTVTDAASGIDPKTTAAALDHMEKAGVILAKTAQLRNVLRNITSIP